MSQLPNGTPFFPKTSSEIRLYERVRLRSFRELIQGAETRMRSPARHSNVLLEDLLKAEVISLQLLLAIEDVAQCVKQNFSSGNIPGQVGKAQCDRTDVEDNSSLKCFQSAVAQSAGALEELTKLQISESLTGENMEIPPDTNSDISNHSLSTPFFCNGIQRPQENCAVSKRLSYGSERTTTSPSEPSWSFSVRVSDLSTTPSDATDLEESLWCAEEATDSESKEKKLNIESIVKDAIKTLRDEMEELQKKHEKQFISYAAKYLELNQDENQSSRKLLEMIMENLSPQDQNWSYHGIFDEHGMEQLFYFVLLQKTLKSCLAVIDTVNIVESHDMEKKVHPRETQVSQMNQVVNTTLSSPRSGRKFEETGQCSLQLLNQIDSCKNNKTDGFEQSYLSENSTAHRVIQLQTVQGHKYDKNKEHENNVVNNFTTQTNRKRMNEFDDEQETKKQRRNKNIFACFNARWQKRRLKRLEKELE